MCVRTPDIPEPPAPPTAEEQWELSPANPKNQTPTGGVAPLPIPVAPPQIVNPVPAATLAPQNQLDIPAPPPQLTGQGDNDQPLVTKKKSKRKDIQQKSKGTSQLRIPLKQAIGGATGGTGSTGLNIPK